MANTDSDNKQVDGEQVGDKPSSDMRRIINRALNDACNEVLSHKLEKEQPDIMHHYANKHWWRGFWSGINTLMLGCITISVIIALVSFLCAVLK